MSASWVINMTVSALLLPPLNLILLCVLGLCLRRRWPRFGMGLAVMALMVLALFSTRFGASLFLTPLEKLNAPLLAAHAADAQAIVVLGAGRISHAPEYDAQDIPSSPALHRMRYAAKLYRATKLPILVTGGRPDGSAESEATIMARVLTNDFAVPVQWLEEASDNTAENAQFSARILRKAGVRRIFLVTNAMHMPRAKLAFEQAGLDVVPAPTIFISATRANPTDFLPSSDWLQTTAAAMHEWLGLAWYWLRYRNLAP